MKTARGWFEPANADSAPDTREDAPDAAPEVVGAADSAKTGRDPNPFGEYWPGSADATTLLPPIVPDDRTAVLPRVRDTTDEPTGRPVAPRGVRVIPLRPVRTENGYKSVYSEVTRTTPVTVVRAVARGTGEVLITLGLVVLLFAAYEVWGKAAIVGAEQTDLDKQLAQEWDRHPSSPPSGQSGFGKAPPAPPSGNALARMYIPRMDKHWVVVQGVRPGDIRYAPGHYPDTALPGQVGNFSVAGHRTPAIFWDLDKVKVGDPIVIETVYTWHVYTVTQSHIVLPNAVQVVAPVPGKTGAKPQKAMLTLTTCNPKYNNYQRLIIHAELSRSAPRAAGRPAEIGG